jgi:arylsulfatase
LNGGKPPFKKMMKLSVSLAAVFTAAFFLVGCAPVDTGRTSQPNILLVVLDDVGFNDLGYFGSEIRTPTIDGLAEGGMVLTDFHVAPNCSPTRAMLLSGVDNHVAGLGNMHEELSPNQKGKPGYEGHLNFRVAALPEVLQDAGYNTYMTGKWHLGLGEETSPSARGFDRTFTLLDGGAGAFDNMLPIVGPGKANYRENGVKLDELPEGFYSTPFYTDRMIEYLEEGRGNGKPFFAYLAYAAPHWPLQAPEASIARYAGVYDDGYDVLRERRLARLQELGMAPDGVEAFARLPEEPAWADLDEDTEKIEARKMEIYAAMVDDVDRYLGELIKYLKASRQYDNTIVVVLSDNGPEAHHLDHGWAALQEWVDSCCDNSLENLGKADSYTWYGPNWGIAGNTPRRMFKGFTSQGGVQVPALIHYPAMVRSGQRSDALLHVTDVMPTLLELAGVNEPGDQFRDREVVPMQGRSMVPLLRGETSAVHPPDHYIGWELFGKRALRQGDWKIVYEPYHELWEPRPAGIETDRWQLYNLAQDPTERYDLAQLHPDRLRDMVSLWARYAYENGVILPDWVSGY